jgi:MFS family permease
LLVVPVLLAFSVLLLIPLSFMDCTGRKKQEYSGDSWDKDGEVELRPWSTRAIVALTSYRFYTGFLNSTWMPYLLAMEGSWLMDERQSLFMGSAKLIYGLSILLNPVFGLLGDQSAAISHWSGRRLFILVGVAVSGLGIYGCMVASHLHSVTWYLIATVLWMLGEAMADVTTETLVPELLPRSQYELSSNIRALNFLIGGLVGYVMLLAFRHFHYSWVYYAYLLLMILCAGLSLVFISAAQSTRPAVRNLDSWSEMLVKAYILPTRVEGGFPRACLCLFIFSLGSAPMFFLLLMLRDIVGVHPQHTLQKHFSIVSIVFLGCAAAASTVGALYSQDATDDESEHETKAGRAGSAADTFSATSGRQQGPQVAVNTWRWPLMVMSTALFGFTCLLIPCTGLFDDAETRLRTFYMVACLLGVSFGSVYSRFQDCTWSLLPTKTDVANLMGFAGMSKLAGVGIGNFAIGMILDAFIMDPSRVSVGGNEHYEFRGYLWMCGFCAFVVGIAAVLVYSVGRMATAGENAEKADLVESS